MTPFPHPAHRTGQADFPHPALGQDFTPLLSRATPSAVSEHSAELIGCPISMSFTTYCVCLELRSLPSTGITRLHGTTNLSATPRRPVDHVAFASRGFEATKQHLTSGSVHFRVNQAPNSTRRQIFLRDPNNVEIELNFEVKNEAS